MSERRWDGIWVIYPEAHMVADTKHDRYQHSDEQCARRKYGSIAPSTSRVEGILQYLPLLGTKGALVLLGRATKYNDNITTDDCGTMALHPFLTRTRH